MEAWRPAAVEGTNRETDWSAHYATKNDEYTEIGRHVALTT